MIQMGLKPDQKIGIICARESALSDSTLASCGIRDLSRIRIVGAQDIPDFRSILECTGQFDSHQLESDLSDLAEQFVRKHPDIGALLLECSDMPPYARAVQNRIKIPVFDYITLIDWIQSGMVRKGFEGFI